MRSGEGPRVLVVGCGGIGGTVAAGLFHQGVAVTALTRNAQIADAINTHGLRTRGELNLGEVAGRAVTELPQDTEPFDYILLATQPPQVEEAAAQVGHTLAHDGAMVTFQNGLCEPRVAAVVGHQRVIGGIIAWGASMVEPGVYDRTSAGGFVLGRLQNASEPNASDGDASEPNASDAGASDAAIERLGHMLEGIGPVTLSDNLMGARWSKLAINCTISSLGTIGGDRLGVLMRKRYVRRLGLEVMSETVAVARAEGIRLEKVSGTLDLDWIALTDSERAARLGSAGLFAKHALLLAVGTRYRRLRSSMLNAIERGRPPAIDFLNGEVVTRGQTHGIPTPINGAIVTLVKRIAAGEARSSHDSLEQLFRDTRALLQQDDPGPLDSAPS